MNRLLLLFALSLSSLALAEAGLPNTFCGQSSCACGTATCGCGQVCNLNQQQCMGAQAGFCSSDGDCAASCGSFICEGNVCTPGTRADSGASSPLPPDAGTKPGGEVPPARGCAAAPGALLWLGAAVLVASLRRRTRR